MATTTLSPQPTGAAALRRKVERLEAQLAALHTFLDREWQAEYVTIQRNADMRVRMEQAARLLQGEDA